MWREPRESSTLMDPREFISLFRCSLWELAGFVLISGIASGIFSFITALLKLNLLYAIIAGGLVGCAFMLSSKDRKIKQLEQQIRIMKGKDR